MHQHHEETKERTFANALLYGAICAGLGLVVLMLGMITQVTGLMILGPLMVLGGIVSVGMGLGKGMAEHNRRFEGPEQLYSDVKILSRSAFDNLSRMVFLDYELEDEGVRFYVNIELSAGNKIEFECAKETWYSCGEGSRGDARTQGKWLTQYIMTVGPKGQVAP